MSTEAATRRLDELETRGRGRAANAAESSALAGTLVAGGRAFFFAGDTHEARKWLSRGMAMAASDVFERVNALSALSLVEAWCENVDQADALVYQALQAARAAGMLAHPSLADAYLASVLTAVERDEPAPSIAVEARAVAAVLAGESHALSPAVPSAGHPLSVDWLPPRAFAQARLPAPPQEAALADPLTGRELEILAYLPTRYTNVELARRCFVSVNTIKTHVAHIYRKLGVTTRDAAISRAEELGIL